MPPRLASALTPGNEELSLVSPEPRNPPRNPPGFTKASLRPDT